MKISLNKVLETDGSITSIAVAPGEPNNIYITKQKGLIQRYDLSTDTLTDKPLLDLTSEIQRVYQEKPMMVNFPDERGLLRLVFHPEYNTLGSLFEGVFIVIHSELVNSELYDAISASQVPNPDHMTCIAQYRYEKGNTPTKTKASRINMICVPEPQANHNGGAMMFGPDGLLWIGLGDGGGANDEHGQLLKADDPESFLGFAQDLMSYKGKILRIEVVQPMPQAKPCLVPQTNPFSQRPEIARPEIASWGLRNPWSMDFDPKHRLFIGDVGQNRFESIKMMTHLGENLGWRAYEGYEVFSEPVLQYIKQKGEKITMPIIAYGREKGIAIVGTEYYIGRIDSLRNSLVFADHGGNIYYAKECKQCPKWDYEKIANLDMMIHGTGKDTAGEIYILGYDRATNKGSVFKII